MSSLPPRKSPVLCSDEARGVARRIKQYREYPKSQSARYPECGERRIQFVSFVVRKAEAIIGLEPICRLLSESGMDVGVIGGKLAVDSRGCRESLWRSLRFVDSRSLESILSDLQLFDSETRLTACGSLQPIVQPMNSISQRSRLPRHDDTLA